jgi:hypothetical protein
MSSTTFSGPVTSQNGFIGTVTGSVTATTLSASGVVILSGLPTADPAVAGQLWNDSGVLTVSAG